MCSFAVKRSVVKLDAKKAKAKVEQRNASVDNFLRIIFVYNPGGSNFMPSN